MSQTINYVSKITKAYQKKGWKGVSLVLKNTYCYRFCWPVLFTKFQARVHEEPKSVNPGIIKLLKLTIKCAQTNRWIQTFFNNAKWYLSVRTRIIDKPEHQWSVNIDLESVPFVKFPLEKIIPVQIPEFEGEVVIEIFLHCNFRWLEESHWKIARLVLPIKTSTKIKPFTFPETEKPVKRYLTVRMDVTEGCNLGCRMCNLRDKEHRLNEIDPDLFDKISHEVFPYAHTVFLSCGREPLLAKDFEHYLKKTIETGVPKIELITNGMLLNQSVSKLLVENQVHRVSISLDSPDGKILAGLRPGSDISVILNNVRFLQSIRQRKSSNYPIIRFNLVLQKQNYRDLIRYLDLGYRLGIDEFKFQHLIVFNDEIEQESLFNLKEETNNQLERAFKHAFDLGLKLEIPSYFTIKPAAPESYPPAAEPPGPACNAPWTSIIFEPDGRVIPCCSLDMFAMGNIKDEHFLEIWNGNLYRMLRRSLLQSENEFCVKNCLAIEGGDPNRPQSIFRQHLNVSR
jgi:radical SAM protein with 4Fe4S-binding SPASM domain